MSGLDENQIPNDNRIVGYQVNGKPSTATPIIQFNVDTHSFDWVASSSAQILSVVKTINTNTGNGFNLDNPTKVPLTGNEVLSDDDFTVNEDTDTERSITCNFTGRIKVTAIIIVINISLNSIRVQNQFNVSINDVLETVSSTYYNRAAAVSPYSSTALIDMLDVIDGDVISIYSTKLIGSSVIRLFEVGRSMLLIERLS